MPITTTLVDHPAIAADNTDAMAQWYEKVLGLVPHVVAGPNPPQTQRVYLVGPPAASGAQGVAAGSMLEIMPRNGTPRHNRNSHEPGHSHIAWRVADFDAAHAHLKACQVTFLSDVIQAIGGGRIISFEDCEGNMIQIVERK